MADMQPNILVLWGDDIGWYNISHNSRGFMLYPAQRIVANEIQSFIEFPPRQKPASFHLDRVFEQLQSASGSGPR